VKLASVLRAARAAVDARANPNHFNLPVEVTWCATLTSIYFCSRHDSPFFPGILANCYHCTRPEQ
jgi:hypothetical protein